MTPLMPIILTWEYPPRIIGDMAHHVDRLSQGLSKAKTHVDVVTCRTQDYSYEKRSENMDVYWASNPVNPHISVITWCLTLNTEIERIVSDIFYAKRHKIYIVDVHDWHFVPAGICLKKSLGIPFIFTLHSLEEQRSKDPQSSLSSCIRGIEGMGAHECDLVMVKSEAMKEEVMRIHGTSKEKITITSPHDEDWITSILEAYERVLASKGERKHA